jgi:hypothetical protein
MVLRYHTTYREHFSVNYFSAFCTVKKPFQWGFACISAGEQNTTPKVYFPKESLRHCCVTMTVNKCESWLSRKLLLIAWQFKRLEFMLLYKGYTFYTVGPLSEKPNMVTLGDLPAVPVGTGIRDPWVHASLSYQGGPTVSSQGSTKTNKVKILQVESYYNYTSSLIVFSHISCLSPILHT